MRHGAGCQQLGVVEGSGGPSHDDLIAAILDGQQGRHVIPEAVDEAPKKGPFQTEPKEVWEANSAYT